MCLLWVACEKCIKRASWGKKGLGRQEAGGRESGSKGHSCRGLMPRVEELEPRNVPQRPLKREVKREGEQGKTRTQASDVSCTALRMFVGEQEGGGISSLSVLSTISISPPATSAPPSPPQALWQWSGLVHKTFPRSCSSLPAFCVTFFVLWAPWFMDGHRKHVCVCVIARLRSRVRREASIRRPEAATNISINVFLLWSLRCVHHALEGSRKLESAYEMISKWSRIWPKD